MSNSYVAAAFALTMTDSNNAQLASAAAAMLGNVMASMTP